MSIFRQFPYTNFHELNLDWLLNKMKDLSNEWNSFLVNWGKEVKEEVDNWLVAHPEATTTVQDGSLTINKFSDDLKKRICICVTDYGIDNTGIHDISEDLNNLISQNGNAWYYFPKGTYLINDTILIDSSCELEFNTDAVIITDEYISKLFYLAPTDQTYPQVVDYPRFIIHGGTIDCGGYVDTVFHVKKSYKSHLYDMKIKNFNNYGIRITAGAGFLVDNCLICGKNGNSEYGYYNSGYDGNVIDTTVINCDTGFYSFNDWYTNCTAWLDENGSYTGSICFHTNGRNNYTQCTSDTYEVAWKSEAYSIAMLTNCNVINNNNVATPTANTYVFLGEAGSIFFYINLFVRLALFTFSDTDSTVSGTNYTDANNIGINNPKQRSFNDFVIPSLDPTITATEIDTYIENASINGYFARSVIDDPYYGWGHLEVIKTNAIITQIANIDGCASITRTSTDNGTTWSSWTSKIKAVNRYPTDFTNAILDAFITDCEYIGYFLIEIFGTPGWGYFRTFKTDLVIVQIAISEHNGAKTRMSNDNGTTWTSWS